MSAQKPPLPDIINHVMQADRYRLTRAWDRMRVQPASAAVDEKLQRWMKQAEASSTRRQARRDLIPELSYDPELPITAHREELVGLLQTRQAIVVCGETGSGKSTQLPKFCLEAGLGVAGSIGHTQPRRLAARAVANRVAEELATKVGELVGFKIRFTDTTKDTTLIKLMTDGVLLAETQSDRFLDGYDALIIDEAHERSLNIDFLLGYLRRTLARRPDLRLIITSATIDPERFAEHFSDARGPAPIVEVSGRTYPVEHRYRPVEEDSQGAGPSGEAEDSQPQAIAEAVDELLENGPGDILTFLPTERDIRLTAKHLRGHFASRGQEKSVEILPLYARLSNAEQNKIFASHSKRRIVLATNVAESSLTVPGIRYVIDTGQVRISRYAPRSRVRRLPIERISQASANQRSGRCGRLGPGISIRLYSEEDYEKRPKYTTPEIRRSDLASVILQSHMLKLGPLEEFPLLDLPGAESIRDGRKTLRELGAIDDHGQLTKIGRQLGKLPTDPRLGRMLIEAHERNCLSEVVIIAAAIECQDVRQRPAGKRTQADEAHQQFQDPHSDFLSFLRLWDFYHQLREKLGRSRLQRALQQKFLSVQGFREWSDIVRQLRDLLQQVKLHPGKRRISLPDIPEDLKNAEDELATAKESSRSRGRALREPRKIAKLKRPDGYAQIHQSLLTGLLSGIAQKGDRHEYKAAAGLSVSLWPGSGLFRRQPKWIVAAEIVETNRRYARCVAEVDVEWIERIGAELLKHSYSDPHWSSKTGSAMVYRRSTLFGLPIVVGRRTQLAPLDPTTARDMLIEHGLVAAEWKCSEKFYLHNQELLADMQELAKRTRSRDFIVDKYHLAGFYSQRLPQSIVDLVSLRKWVKENRETEQQTALWMRAEDLLPETSNSLDIDHDFPNTVEVGQTSLPLEYEFEPGGKADGVTITVPEAALRQISDERLGWLVPGLLEEKILHLIRALPKSLRTNFVPAPDVARMLAAELSQVPQDKPFSTALCEVMRVYSGESITPQDFALEKVPDHLRFLVRVINDEGELVGSSRDVGSLQKELAPAVERVSRAPRVDNWSNRVVTPQDFDSLPQSVMVERGGLKVEAFPTLVDQGDKVELLLVDTRSESERKTALGLVRLFATKHARALRGQVANLPQLQQSAVRLGHLIPDKQLRSQLQDLIARIALVEHQPPIHSRVDFEARNAKAGVQISIAAQEVAIWLPKLAEQVHQLRLQMEKAPPTWNEVIEDITAQLNELLAADFLQTTPWQWLTEVPRYLESKSQRLQKMSSGGLPKDRKLRSPIEELWRQFEQLSENNVDADQRAKLEEFRWLIEELRVSIFSQKLGTKVTVSEKRLAKFLETIR